MNSTISNSLSPFSSNATNSNSNMSQNSLQMLFHAKTSPLVQLNAWFFAFSVTPAHICCSANNLASDMSQKWCHVLRLVEFEDVKDLRTLSSMVELSLMANQKTWVTSLEIFERLLCVSSKLSASKVIYSSRKEDGNQDGKGRLAAP
nr:hypothetical protein Ahy_B01g055568 isoform A [Ipomoea batatas]